MRMQRDLKPILIIYIVSDLSGKDKGKACISSEMPMSYNSEAKLRKNYFTEIMKKAREK